MISILFLEVPFWIAIPLVLVVMLLFLLVLVKAYIRWRIRLYSEASNIRQTHMLMQESTDGFKPLLALAARWVSSREEAARWDALLAQEQGSSQNPFPERPPEAVSIPVKSGIMLLYILVAGLVVVANLMVFRFSLVGVVVALVLAAVLWFIGKRYGVRVNNPRPGLVLSEKGLLFPEKGAFYPWAEVDQEGVFNVSAGRSSYNQLRFYHGGKRIIRNVDVWETTAGEIRYLLILYRSIYNQRNRAARDGEAFPEL